MKTYTPEEYAVLSENRFFQLKAEVLELREKNREMAFLLDDANQTIFSVMNQTHSISEKLERRYNDLSHLVKKILEEE